MGMNTLRQEQEHYDPHLSFKAQQQTSEYISTFYIIPMNDRGFRHHTILSDDTVKRGCPSLFGGGGDKLKPLLRAGSWAAHVNTTTRHIPTPLNWRVTFHSIYTFTNVAMGHITKPVGPWVSHPCCKGWWWQHSHCMLLVWSRVRYLNNFPVLGDG